jgi:hypothetical protein
MPQTHPNEPSTERLTIMRRDLANAVATDDNIKRLHAIDAQIKRRGATPCQ